MELYSRDISPFASRVRVSILAKRLPITIIDSPDVAGEAFGKLTPLRRVPVLVLSDGSALPESETIVEYLEDAYPEIPLRPDGAAERAQVRLIARVAELYLFPAAVPIFAALAKQDQRQVDELFAELHRALGQAASFLPRGASWHAFGGQLTTADAALAPFLFYVSFLGQAAGRSPLAEHPRLLHFWEGAQKEPVLATVINQIAGAFRSRRSSSS